MKKEIEEREVSKETLPHQDVFGVADLSKYIKLLSLGKDSSPRIALTLKPERYGFKFKFSTRYGILPPLKLSDSSKAAFCLPVTCMHNAQDIKMVLTIEGCNISMKQFVSNRPSTL